MILPILSLVVPCYNEEDVLKNTIERLLEVLNELEQKEKISSKSFLFLVDDGSKDKTFQIICDLHSQYPQKVKAISFIKNFGNQKAILAGLLELKKFDFDCCITIDADLQQDENKIEEFIEKYNEGHELVYGVKNERNDDSFLKKICAIGFYKLMNVLGAKTCPNHSEYRLVSKRLVNILNEYGEHNIFLRGIFQEMGNNPAIVYYDVKKRMAGVSKFSLFDLFSLAVQGITSFSTVPLRLVTFTGILISFFAFLLGMSAVFEKIFNLSVPGWATIVAAVSFIGGIQILSIGIIGEYLGQIFTEVKSRPRYIIDKELN
ncbi:glycosyltransferase family 2 protein [bacterium]|nr:glycosyltransferase family 2 protein [bacterium]